MRFQDIFVVEAVFAPTASVLKLFAGRRSGNGRRRSNGREPGCVAAPLAAVAALAFTATAQAQTTAVCSDTPAAGERIQCVEDAASTDDIAIDASGLAIETTADQESGIGAFHGGEGDIRIESRSDSITTAGQLSYGIGASHSGGTGDVFLRVFSTDIRTNRSGADAFAHGIFGETTTSGRLDAVVTGGSIATLGDISQGIFLRHAYAGSGAAGALTLDIGGGIAIETSGDGASGIYTERKSDGDIRLTLRDAAIGTAGAISDGVLATLNNDPKPDIAGDVRVDLLGGVRIETAGADARGILAEATGNDPAGRSDVTVTARGGNSIVTEGDNAFGLTAQRLNGGAGDVLVDLRGLSVTTGGKDAHGLSALHQGPGDIDIRVSGGGVTTRGVGARGIFAWRNDGGPGDIRILARNHRIVTESTDVDATSQVTEASGIYAVHNSQGDIVIDLRGGSIETRGVRSHGVIADHFQAENGGDVLVRTGGGHRIATAGEGAHGITALNAGTTAGTGAIVIDVGGSVQAGGAEAHGIAAGDINADGMVTGASPLGADGYRRQTVRVDGRVYGGTGTGAGVYLAGGGRVFIGPRGLVGALSGVAVRAVGNTVVDGETVPRRLLVHLLPDARSPAALLDGSFVNDGGETVLAVNGTPLYDSEEGGRTGLWVSIGFQY